MNRGEFAPAARLTAVVGGALSSELAMDEPRRFAECGMRNATKPPTLGCKGRSDLHRVGGPHLKAGRDIAGGLLGAAGSTRLCPSHGAD